MYVTKMGRKLLLAEHIKRLYRETKQRADYYQSASDAATHLRQVAMLDVYAAAFTLLKSKESSARDVYLLAQRHVNAYPLDATPYDAGAWQGWRLIRDVFQDYSVLLEDPGFDRTELAHLTTHEQQLLSTEDRYA